MPTQEFLNKLLSLVRFIGLCLFFLIPLFLIYQNSLNSGFLHYDDPMLILNQPLIQNFSWIAIKNFYRSIFDVLGYPLIAIFTYFIELKVLGLDAFYMHLNQIILHAVNATLIFILLKELEVKRAAAFILTLAFAFSSLQVEAVAWLSQRRDLLSAFFYLLGCIYYIRKARCGWGIPSVSIFLILWILSFLSKPIGITLPIMTICIDKFFIHGRKTKADQMIKVLLFLLVGFFGLYFVYNTFYLTGRWKNIVQQVFITNEAMFFYITRPFFPLDLHFLYPYQEILKTWSPLKGILKYVFNVLFLLLIVKISRRDNYMRFGLCWFLLNISLPLILTLYASANEITSATYNNHSLYLAILGIYLIFYRLGVFCIDKGYIRKSILAVILTVLFITGIIQTKQQINLWKDEGALFTDIINTYPEYSDGYNYRALFWYDGGQLDLALKDLNQGIEKAKDPQLSLFYNKAKVHMQLNQNELALKSIEQALQIRPESKNLLWMRAKIYFQLNDCERARDDVEQIQKLDAGFIDQDSLIGMEGKCPTK